MINILFFAFIHVGIWFSLVNLAANIMSMNHILSESSIFVNSALQLNALSQNEHIFELMKRDIKESSSDFYILYFRQFTNLLIANDIYI